MKCPLVSVVITTKNEEKNIANCLNSIVNQSYKNLEIIIVDNNSTDKTKEIAKKYTDKTFNKGPERSAQRNFGIRKGLGEYTIYLDADMILSSNVIKECVEKMQSQKDLIALYIPERIVSRPVTEFSRPITDYQDSYWIKVRDFERQFYNATVIDCVRFVEQESFEKVDGFDESMSGPEDWDFDKKIRVTGKTDIIQSEIFHNEGSFDMNKYLAKKAYYSKSFDLYMKKWGVNNPDLQKQFGAFYRMFGVFFENEKWKRIIRHPFLFGGTVVLKTLVGFEFILRGFK